MENAKLVFGGRLILLLCTEVVLYEMLLEASRLLTLFYRYTCSNDICYPDKHYIYIYLRTDSQQNGIKC